jgi:hypothetical protein
MRPTPRTQPYRLGAPRMPGLVLNAMLGGRQAGALNPADYRRQRMQMAAGRPQAMTDVRDFGQPPVPSITTGDNFGGGPPTSVIPGHAGARGGAPHGDVTATRAGLEASAVIRAIQALRAGQPIGAATQARLRSTAESGAARRPGFDPVSLIQASDPANQHTLLMAALRRRDGFAGQQGPLQKLILQSLLAPNRVV